MPDHSRFVEMKTNEYKETWFFDSEDDIPYFSFKSCLVCVKIIGISSWIALMMILQA